MTFKNKNQLEKGCGKKLEDYEIHNLLHPKNKAICSKENKLCLKCQATLTQTNEIIKLIDKTNPKEIEFESFDGKELIFYFKKKILTKIRGKK